MIQNRSNNGVRYGRTREDGAQRVFFDGKPAGWLMPQASQATLEASAGIQQWSHPRGKVATKLWDGGASILDFSAYWEKHYQKTYPFATVQS